MTKIFKAHDLARDVISAVRHRVATLGRRPRALILQQGGHPAMQAYGQRLRDQAELLGIDLEFQPYEADLAAQFTRLAVQPWDGIMTLYPLPKGEDPIRVSQWVGADRDMDGLHPLNAGLLASGDPMAITPATAKACLRVLRHLKPDLRGAEIVLVGASVVVGRPLAQLLLQAEASVTLCHIATRDLAAHLRRAEVVVTAAGVAGLIKGEDLAQGALVVDVSILPDGQGGLVGDVDLPSAMGRAAVVTHVPEGLGPLTTACLFENLLDLCDRS